MGTCDGMINNKVLLFVSALGGAGGLNRFGTVVINNLVSVVALLSILILGSCSDSETTSKVSQEESFSETQMQTQVPGEGTVVVREGSVEKRKAVIPASYFTITSPAKGDE